MEFHLLGELEVLRDGVAVPVSGAKQRALLAVLVLRANEVVSRDELLELLWQGRADAGHSLDIQISRLRKTLEPEQPLTTRAGGYVLEVDPESIDVRRFERLLREGREANAAGLPAEAERLLADALALWRGAALADAGADALTIDASRLEELRLAAVEERIDAELALGRHRALVPELESLVAAQPLRERPHAQLMLALYRSGRQADALRVYDDARRALLDELGLEPGPQLRQLQQEILRQDRTLDAPPSATAGHRRRAGLGALTLLATGAVAAAALLLTGGGTHSSQARSLARPNSVAFVSVRSGKPVARADGVRLPISARFYRGALWILTHDGILERINPASGKVTRTVNTVRSPCGLAVGEGSVWVTDCDSPHVVRVDPGQGVVGDCPIPVSPTQPNQSNATTGVAVGAGSVWVGQGFDNPSHVYRLNPRNCHLQRGFIVPDGGAGALAFGDGALWVGGNAAPRLSRIDPRTRAVTLAVHDVGGDVCCVAAGGGYVWAVSNPAGRIWKLAPDGQLVAGTRLPVAVSDLTYADGAVWASAGTSGTVTRIDEATDATRTYRVGHRVTGLSVANGVLAAAVQPSEADVTAGLHGRIARVAFAENRLDWTSTDPLGVQFAFNPEQVQFHYATCAKLYNYPDAARATGRRLVPEVAAGWPRSSNGGSTWTFRIRPGFGFSPPSHEQVTAASFRHEIERLLAPGMSRSWGLLSDVTGAAAYNSGAATHLAGVSARGNTLVVRLDEPAGDLALRFADPLLCAVPKDLPTTPYGLRRPIPTAGPYYLANRSDDVFVLRRNPNYHGPRPQRLDAIVIRTGVDAQIAVAQLGRGEVDYVPTQDPVLEPGSLTARRAGGRYRLTSNNWHELIALNPSRPLFARASARRAVVAALDVRALAAGLDGGAFQLPTARVLPSAGAGGAPARTGRGRLPAGRHLVAVLAVGAPPSGPVFNRGIVPVLRTQLAAIGIGLRVVPLREGSSPEVYTGVLEGADFTETGGNEEFARDPVTYLLGLPYLPQRIAAKLYRIALLPSPAREAAAAAVAAELERDGYDVGISDRATAELVSSRLGCVVDHPEYPGIDLAALCLR